MLKIEPKTKNILNQLEELSHKISKIYPQEKITIANAKKYIIHLEKDNARLKRELKNKQKQYEEKEEKLQQEIKGLKDKLSIDSHNSSKPPSTDGFKKKARPISLRTKSSKKQGGQQGHPGKTLELSANPDERINLEVQYCECCGKDLSDVSVSKTEQRQIFDIPKIKIKITEYISNEKICACGHRNKAKFPKSVKNTTQYGSNFKSSVAYLNNYQLIPYKRTSELLSDLLNINLSPGTIYNINKELYNLLFSWSESALKELLESKVVNVDESGIRGFFEGKIKNKWLHTVCTKYLTYYFIHNSRGKKAINELDFIPNFKNILVHDFFKTYFSYDNCLHSVCNQHLLRDLNRVIESSVWERGWALKMRSFLYYAKSIVDRAKSNGLSSLSVSTLDTLSEEYDKIVSDALNSYNISAIKRKITISKNKSKTQPCLFPEELSPPPLVKDKKTKNRKQSFGRNLLDRFINYKNEILRFIYDFSVPFTNNLAEQSVRMIKLKAKISGFFRSEKGEKFFCRIRSYISSMKKQGVNVFDALSSIFDEAFEFT